MRSSTTAIARPRGWRAAGFACSPAAAWADRPGTSRFAGAGGLSRRQKIAVVGADRVSSFAELQDALSRGRAERLTYQSSI